MAYIRSRSTECAGILVWNWRKRFYQFRLSEFAWYAYPVQFCRDCIPVGGFRTVTLMKDLNIADWTEGAGGASALSGVTLSGVEVQ